MTGISGPSMRSQATCYGNTAPTPASRPYRALTPWTACSISPCNRGGGWMRRECKCGLIRSSAPRPLCPRAGSSGCSGSGNKPNEEIDLSQSLALGAGRWRGDTVGEQIERLARFVAETRWEDIPEAVRQHAKLVLLDTLGVILAGSEQPEVRQLRQRLIASGGAGATVFARGWPASDPRTAALLNGIAGRSIELCEGHRYVSCQGAVQIVPAVLATGEWANRNGRDVLSALILGYDVAVRIGACLTPRALAHQNGQAPLLGAVAAGARLRSLNAEDTSRALRIGATLVLTPSYTNAVAGATGLNVAGGMSGFAAALAPELALAGFA